MAMLFSKVKLYLEANGKTWEEEDNNIILENHSDGRGDIIASWNVSGLEQPTEEQLNTLESQSNSEEALTQVYKNRRKEYPSIEEAVHAILDDDLENLQIKRQTIKDKYSKG